MDAQAFTELALRVIAREASETDCAALDTELAAVPARREEFEQLKVTHDILRVTAPVLEATRVREPALPVHRIGELRTAVRQHFGPATAKTGKSEWHVWAHVLRWVFGGGGLAAAIFAVVMFSFANKTIEIGLYKTDLVRGEQGLTTKDLPQAMLIAFDQDAPFDAWQARPLAWNERAKVWVDNEHDLLYFTHRVRNGQILTESQPLAPTDAAQCEQIKSVVAGL